MEEQTHTHKKRSERSHRAHRRRPVHTGSLITAAFLTAVITILEIAGGILSGSLALLSSAFQNLSNTCAAFLAYLANKPHQPEGKQKKPLFYNRLEILIAMLNAVVLVVMGIFLILEAWDRLQDPVPVRSMVMLVVGLVGLLANLFALVILKKDSGKSKPVGNAYFHILGGGFISVLVIAGGIAIQLYRLYWIDPLISGIISLFLFREAFTVLKESSRILVRSAPGDLDLSRIRQQVEHISEVDTLYHLHTWMQSDRDIHLEAHVELNSDLTLSQIKPTREYIENMLKQEFNVRHVTLQFEFNGKGDPGLLKQETR